MDRLAEAQLEWRRRTLRVSAVKHFLRVSVFAGSVLLLTGCGSIISRTVPGQGHNNQYYPGVQWDVRDSAWRFLRILDLPLSLVIDTLLLPVDAQHGPYE